MNTITDILFTASWFILLIWAIRLMTRGWNQQPVGGEPLQFTKKVTKPVHPEMVDVKPGDELLGVTFGKNDGLHQDLQERIDELEEEEDDDEEGDIIVRV